MTEIATIGWFGKWGTSFFSENTAIFFQYIFIKLADNQDSHNISDKLEFGPDLIFYSELLALLCLKSLYMVLSRHRL